MKLGIMQPYFFPYVGYFDLINRTDRWIVFDTVQYTPKSWMNRNRILHPASGWQYVTVPVSHHDRCAISEAKVVDKETARRRILGQVEHYRKGRAPFFREVRDLIERSFAAARTDSLVDLNVCGLALTAQYLEIPFVYSIFSEMGIALPEVTHPGGWALEISSALGAAEYVNPPGGRELFSPQEFAARGIRLSFTEPADYRYPCGGYAFVERLSIIDVMMWNSPAAIKGFLDGLAAKREGTTA